jgi:DNA modification methylase
MCGDSTDRATVEKLMNGEKADLLHTDPPYNVDYSNQDRPKAGKKDHGRIKNDSMGDDQFREFLTKALTCGFEFCKDDSSAYVWYPSKESVNFMEAAKASGWDVNQQIIWKKPMLLGRGRYQWAHEPCLYAVKGKPWFTDDRTKTTVWDFGGYDKSKNVHPTQKPVCVPEEAVSNSSKIGSIVLDLFLGSGSTLIACEKTGRKCYGLELDPHYCSVILKRYIDFVGSSSKVFLSTDKGQIPFEEVCKMRKTKGVE